MTYQLFDYQNDLVNKAMQSLAHQVHDPHIKRPSVFIQSPPGSGKSVIIAEIVRRATALKHNRVLFFVHRKELTEQIKQDLIKNDCEMQLVDLITEQSLVNKVHKHRNFPQYQLIITDEAHHSLAKGYQEIYQAFPNAMLVGFSATPWRMKKESFKEIYNDIVCGLQVTELIQKKRLAPYHYYTPQKINFNKLKVQNGEYSVKSIDNALSKYIYGDVVKNYHKFANGQKTILYAHSRIYSYTFAKVLKENGINAVHVDATTPTKERQQIMDDFKCGKIKVLCNVDLISEGFNVPDCSCVMLLRPTKSITIFLQQAMRCMRYQPNKKATIIDMVGNAENLGMLPNTVVDWSLFFSGKKKEFVQNVTECQYCYENFYIGKDAPWQTFYVDDATMAKINQADEQNEDAMDVVNQLFWEDAFINKKDFEKRNYPKEEYTRVSLLFCPRCYKITDITIYGKDEKDNEKQKVDSDFDDISEQQNHLKFMAHRKTNTAKSVIDLYQIFDAKKQLNIKNSNGKAYKPAFATVSSWIGLNHRKLRDDELNQLADISHNDPYFLANWNEKVFLNFKNQKRTWKPKDYSIKILNHK